jgi:hypothetical protein
VSLWATHSPWCVSETGDDHGGVFGQRTRRGGVSEQETATGVLGIQRSSGQRHPVGYVSRSVTRSGATLKTASSQVVASQVRAATPWWWHQPSKRRHPKKASQAFETYSGDSTDPRSGAIPSGGVSGRQFKR